MANLVFLIPLLPLIGFLIIGLGGKKLSKKLAGIIGCTSVLGSFLIVLTLLFPFMMGTMEPFTVSYFEWITVGDVDIRFSFLIDSLSTLMMTIVTGVGFFIHVYSAGYMHDDKGYARYFAYLNLFIFSMLLLVMGSNFIVLFAGWEGVGLCSYLLIGFWFKRNDFNNAAKKAFIMNRVGDLAFLLGIILIFVTFGSFEFDVVFEQARTMFTPEIASGVIFAITLLLFIGATGKSAQIPLYTWLPDAMAGPTPVSALIHAATMVTAGIYMIVRCNVLYTLAPATLEIILVIGLATAIITATIGLVQNDIKKVLAYSTVSQLGFMFIAIGLGAYSVAIFHVTTHAFFKALLFLGSGSVIHAMSGEQDLRSMGGLKKVLPVTYFTFLVGTLAISGIPPFAGFFSKDEILAHAFEHSPIIWAIVLIGAALTAFYMFRLFFLTFHGSFRGTESQKSHLHESPSIMTIPLIVLAVLSAVGGFIGIPQALGGTNALNEFLKPIIITYVEATHELSTATELALMGGSVVVVLIMIAIAYTTYVKKAAVPADDTQISGFHKLLYNKYYVDEIYQAIIVKPIMAFSDMFYKTLEIKIIDRIVNGTGKGVNRSSSALRFLQNGSTSYYLFAMVIGIILIVSFTAYGDYILRLF
ncbi:NADH-quinone oxidoreductase subunit L [Cytophagaceae bacterium ABcell3]|nr:NADH-quinone oxidoreductase subunit L [Cytophagaceae bacterium ABcell3]